MLMLTDLQWRTWGRVFRTFNFIFKLSFSGFLLFLKSLMWDYNLIHAGFCILSCRALNNFNKFLVIVIVPNIKKTNWLFKQYHVKTSPCFYRKLYHLLFIKCTKNQKLARNSNLREFRRSSFGDYMHVTFIS